MQSKAAPDMETLREITKSLNPDTVKDLIDAAGVSKVCERMNIVEHIRGRLIKLFTVRGGDFIKYCKRRMFSFLQQLTHRSESI